MWLCQRHHTGHGGESWPLNEIKISADLFTGSAAVSLLHRQILATHSSLHWVGLCGRAEGDATLAKGNAKPRSSGKAAQGHILAHTAIGRASLNHYRMIASDNDVNANLIPNILIYKPFEWLWFQGIACESKCIFQFSNVLHHLSLLASLDQFHSLKGEIWWLRLQGSQASGV